MNSWNFNELTQQDVLDYKACQRKDGSVYGVPDKSDCVKGKEITKEEIQRLAIKSNRGDKKASAVLDQVSKVNKEQKIKANKEKAEAEKKKKAAEAEKKDKKKGGKGKKGAGKGKKGGAGKKGGGKGKGGAGKKGGGSAKKGGSGSAKKGGGTGKSIKVESKSQREARQNRKSRQQEMRKHLSDLQGALRKVKDPAARKVLEDSITELMKGVAELSKTEGQAPEPGKAPTSGTTPPAPKAEKKEKA